MASFLSSSASSPSSTDAAVMLYTLIRKHLLRISLQHSQTVAQCFDNTLKHKSAFSNVFRFTQSIGDLRTGVNFVVQLKLKLFLRHFDQPVSNLFGNRVSHVSEDNSEIRVDTRSDLFDEHILSTLSRHDWLHRPGRLLLHRNWFALRIELLRLWLLSRGRWYDALSGIFVVRVICKEVVLLSVDHSINDFTSMVALCT